MFDRHDGIVPIDPCKDLDKTLCAVRPDSAVDGIDPCHKDLVNNLCKDLVIVVL